MATIILRNVPDELIEKIKQSAALEGQSVPSEVLRLAEIGLWNTLRRRAHARAVESLRRRLADKPRFAVSSTELLDEDRR